MDKTALEKALQEENITNDERQMWMRAGFYVTLNSVAYNPNEGVSKHFYVSNKGDVWHIPDFIANNLRAAVIAWWDNERLKPVSVLTDDISELEIERG